MNIDEMVVHGWKFQLINDQLSITSEQNANEHVELNAKAAFSLLDYLYQYRDALAKETQGKEEVDRELNRATMGASFGSGATASDSPDSGLTSRGL